MPTSSDIAEAIRARLGRGRRIVALAGAPGSGKSTLADALAGPLGAQVLPMDGFHYDDAVLGPRGLLPRKGAPETFDVGGLVAVIERLRAGGPVAVPVFDRALEASRAAARVIEAPTVVVEGNYLLLDAAPWDALAPLLDLTLRLEVPEGELRRRLEDRWAALDPAEGRRKVEENDLPNGRLVAARSRPADMVLRPGEGGAYDVDRSG